MDVKVITPDNFNDTITQDSEGKWGVNVTPVTNVTEVTKLSPSQLYVQTGTDYNFIELHERPAFVKGLDQRLISEVTGYKEFTMTGLGNRQVVLQLHNIAAIFPFNDVKIVSLNCELYEVSDDIATSVGWGMKNPEMHKEVVVTKPDAKSTRVDLNIKLALQDETNKERKYRIYYTIRVAERNI